MPVLSQLQVTIPFRQAVSLDPHSTLVAIPRLPKCPLMRAVLCPQDSGDPPLIQRLLILVHGAPRTELCGFQV
jgi:hypothetical protein